MDVRESIGYVYWDMWCAYMKAIPKKLPQVLKILDRYHLVVNLDKVGVEEARELKEVEGKILK